MEYEASASKAATLKAICKDVSVHVLCHKRDIREAKFSSLAQFRRILSKTSSSYLRKKRKGEGRAITF